MKQKALKSHQGPQHTAISKTHVQISRQWIIIALHTKLPFIFSWIHKSPYIIASFKVLETTCNCSLQSVFFQMQGWYDKSDKRIGICCNFGTIIFHLPGNPLTCLALLSATGTLSWPYNNHSSLSNHPQNSLNTHSYQSSNNYYKFWAEWETLSFLNLHMTWVVDKEEADWKMKGLNEITQG